MNEVNWAAEDWGKICLLGLNRTACEFQKRGIWLEGKEQSLLNFASNDYLQMADNPNVVNAAQQCLEEFGLGTGAARLLSGTTPVHAALERSLADFLGLDSVAVFSSGYLANIGLISSAVGRHDVVVSDKLVHASIIDGIRLSEAKHFRFHHNDLEDAERLLRKARQATGNRRVLLVTESVFSMDGDLAPLKELLALAEQHEAATCFDEAHAIGVFGEHGAGRSCGMKKTFLGGTLSKSLGACGGFIGGDAKLKEWLHSTARSFIFNTSIPAALCAGALAALNLIQANSKQAQELLQKAHAMREKLEGAGLNCFGSRSQIIPILVGDREKSLKVSRDLAKRGLFIPAIRPPTVREGTERLRISITSGMTEEILAQAALDIIEVMHLHGIGS